MQEMVLLEDLHVVATNPRRGVGDVRELAASIKAVGIIEPLVVTMTNGVIAGSRRLAAARMAGLLEVPVIRRDADVRELQELMLIENLQRADLAPLEEAAALQVLVDIGAEQKDIGKRIGRSQSWVSKRLSLLALPEKAQEALYSGGISIHDAEELAKIASTPKIVDRIVDRIAAGEKITVGAAVGVEQRSEELHAELEARKAELEAEGKTVLVEERGAPIGGLRDLWNTSDQQRHESEPCVAVKLRIGFNHIDEELVCTDPDRHADADDVRQPDRARERAEREAEEKVLELAKQGRLAASQEICRKMPMKQTTELIELAIIAGASDDWNDYTRALAVLELPVPEDGKSDPLGLSDNGEEQAILEQHAAHSDKARHHAALALSMARIEGLLTWTLWTETLVQRYFALLAIAGYEPSEAERAKLEPPSAEDDDDEPAITDG
jgi:ParB/RepB/Spo0J family partition protein